MAITLSVLVMHGLLLAAGGYLLARCHRRFTGAGIRAGRLPLLLALLTFFGCVLLSAGLEAASFFPGICARVPLLETIFHHPVYRAVQGVSACVLGAAGVVLTAVSRPRFRREKRSAMDRLLRMGILAAGIAALAAALPFNYRFFESLSFPRETAPLTVAFGEGVTKTAPLPGAEEDFAGYYRLDPDKGDCTIELNGLDSRVENLYLHIQNETPVVHVTVSATDEGSSLRFNRFPQASVFDGSEASRYLRLHLYGDARDVHITLSPRYDLEMSFCLWDVGVNRVVPYRFSILRALLWTFLLFITGCLLPASGFYAVGLNVRRPVQRRLIAAVCIATALLLVAPTPLLSDFIHEREPQNDQYEAFAESLLGGSLAFAYEVDPGLAALENPYDSSARDASAARWDHAFYQGRYYMYFGIVPEMLHFLPFRVLTGRTLPTYASIALSIMGLCAGVFLLLSALAGRFARPRLLTYLICCVSFSVGCGLLLNRVPTVYIVPIAAANMLAVLGLYFWVSSIGRDGLVPWRVCLGSVCIALVFGCRPQAGLVFLAAIPLYWKAALHERSLLSRQGMGNTLCLMLPFLLVALGLMWYNNARFGSPMDFGANYNLTTNDMTRRGFSPDRIPAGLFAWFVQPASLSFRFPYLLLQRVSTAYQGVTIAEPSFGSVFCLSPVLLSLPLAPFCAKTLKDKNLWPFFLLLLLLPLVIAVADIEMAGVLYRYLGDFLFLLFTAAALVLFALDDTVSGGAALALRRALCAAFLMAMLFALCFLFAEDESGNSYGAVLPRIFEIAKYLTALWA